MWDQFTSPLVCYRIENPTEVIAFNVIIFKLLVHTHTHEQIKRKKKIRSILQASRNIKILANRQM